MTLHFTRRVAFAVLFASVGGGVSAEGLTPVTAPRTPPQTVIPGVPSSLPDGAVVMMSFASPTEQPPVPETTPRPVGAVSVKAELLLSRPRFVTESTSARWQPVNVGASASMPLQLPLTESAVSVPGLELPPGTDPAQARKQIEERFRSLSEDERLAMLAQMQAPPGKVLQWDVATTVLKADDEGADVAVKWTRLDVVANRAPAVAASGSIDSLRIPHGKQRFLDLVRLEAPSAGGSAPESVVVALGVDRVQPSPFTARQLEYEVWLVQGGARTPIGRAQATGLDGGRIELRLPMWRRALDLAGLMKDPPRVDIGCRFGVTLTGTLVANGDIELLVDTQRELGILQQNGISNFTKDGGRKRLAVKPGEVVAFDIPITERVMTLGLTNGMTSTFTSSGIPTMASAPGLGPRGYALANGALVFSVGDYFRNNPVQLLVSAKPLADQR